MLLAPIAVLICSGAVLVELQYGGFARFLADHPLSAGFVSGFLLSLLAWVIVGVVVDSFRESRWEALSAMAFGALQHETTLMIDTLTWLVVGAVPENQARPSASAQRALAERHDQLLGGPVDAAEMDQHKVPHQLYRCRLTAL